MFIYKLNEKFPIGGDNDFSQSNLTKILHQDHETVTIFELLVRAVQETPKPL